MNFGIYTRKSYFTDSSDSVKMQLEACQEYISRMADEITSITPYEDDGYVRSDIDRPAMNQLRADVADGGMGSSAAEGAVIPRVFVLMGDAELNEGSIWEAFMSAAHYKLSNLIAIIDRNHLSYDGNTEDVMAIEPLEDKLRAFGWDVVTCDGHDVSDLVRAFDEALGDIGGCAGGKADGTGNADAGVAGADEGKPHVIIADTIKGKGVSFMESVPSYHHASITEEQYEQAKVEIMAMPG